MLQRRLICDSIRLPGLANPAGAEAGSRNSSYLDEGPHGEKVGQHCGEPLSQAALGNEAKLQLRQTNGIISLLPGPAGDVEQVRLQTGHTHTHTFVAANVLKSESGRVAGTSRTSNLVVVLQHLSDNPDFWMVVLDGDHSGGGTKVT